MDIDSPPLPPDSQHHAMELDDLSFEALTGPKPDDGSIQPPALMSVLRQQADFGDFFAASPCAQPTRARSSSVLLLQREQQQQQQLDQASQPSAGGKKRSFEPDQSFDLSSEDASPSSPLAQIQVPARPTLQKAASVATTVFPGFGPSRRRVSDRSASSGRSSVTSTRMPGSGQSSRRTSFDSSPPRDERIQLQKKARGDAVETIIPPPTRPFQPRRADSAGSNESNDEGLRHHRQTSAGNNKAAQQSMGLGLPPPARSSGQSLRPRHVTSASESFMSFAQPKRRVASDSAAKVMPPETRMESDGKRLPCHQVAEDGLMRIKPETVRLMLPCAPLPLPGADPLSWQVSDLMQGKYDQIIERFVVVDCRFSFEFEGGHVDGAVNIQDESQLLDYFLTPGQGFLAGSRALPEPCISDDPGLKPVIIFHCEFSQKRAPAMCVVDAVAVSCGARLTQNATQCWRLA